MNNLSIMLRFIYLIIILFLAFPIAIGILIVRGGIGLANTIDEWVDTQHYGKTY